MGILNVEAYTLLTFFEHQEAARKRTWLLVVYFIVALGLIITCIYIAVCFLVYKTEEMQQGQYSGDSLTSLWDPELFAIVAFSVFIVVGLGSIYKIFALAGGGRAVAEMLGGRLILPASTQAMERRILNVVEEMAIASGVSTPPVYVMDHEQSINAFAAGYGPKDAVIGVSAGCLQHLNRDELQGVIAHEFSHILNGDMRLNIRLIGLLHGILLIALLGYWMLRSGAHGGRSRSRRDSGGGQIVLFALALMVVGYIGVFFGKLIKAAVSRQREYLADASAVQFTRNPQGIAGALKKIGGLVHGSKVEISNAEEASHMFFADGVSSSFFRMLQTHPPLKERILRIDPSFKGHFPGVDPERPADDGETMGFASKVSVKPILPEQMADRVGAPLPEHLSFAASFLASLSKQLREAAHEPYGARAVVYSLLIDGNESVREKQLIRLSKLAEAEVYKLTLRLWKEVQELGESSRLPLIDLALPSLSSLSLRQYEAFKENIKQLVLADERCSLFEYALEIVVHSHLDPVFSGRRANGASHTTLRPVMKSCQTLLSLLAEQGHEEISRAELAFEKALPLLHPKLVGKLEMTKGATLKQLDAALMQLANTSPAIKKRVVGACSACITSDGAVSVEEAELMRAIGAALDCPIPPFLPGEI